MSFHVKSWTEDVLVFATRKPGVLNSSIRNGLAVSSMNGLIYLRSFGQAHVELQGRGLGVWTYTGA